MQVSRMSLPDFERREKMAHGWTCREADHLASGVMELPEERFDELVDEALSSLPEMLLENLDNVLIMVEHEPEDGSDVLGWYEGTALTERDTSYGMGHLPDRVVLFRGPLTRMCEDEEDLREEIGITLLHELGHYHGIDEERLHALGWG